MSKLKKKRADNLRWLILVAIILLFLFLVFDIFFTGYLVEEESIMYTEGQIAPEGECGGESMACNSDENCCEEFSCQEGLCKWKQGGIGIMIYNGGEQVGNLIQCPELNESCNMDLDCCEGLQCTDGLCKQNNIRCIDSDGGQNYYLKGYISGFDNNNEYFSYIKDTCVSEQELTEAYCVNEVVNFENTLCINNCEDGVCKCKSSEQTCNSGIECCIGFNCVDNICVSQGESVSSSFENKELCTFVGHPCEEDSNCCSKNCLADWKFLFWESDTKTCGFAETGEN
jgi:hypothetical protein